MGRSRNPRPDRLAEKLRHIRTALQLSQNEMIQRMDLTGELSQGEISDFERDKRVPSLQVLLEYARVAGIYMDALVDDEVDLPVRLPCSPRSEGLKRTSSRKKKHEL